MIWVFYYLGLFLLLACQIAWKGTGFLFAAPDLFLASAVAFSLFARPRKLALLILPLAVLRAYFYPENPFFVIAFFCVVGFLLQEFRHSFVAGRIKVQFGLAFLATFVFFVFHTWIADGSAFSLWDAGVCALVTGGATLVLGGFFRSFPVWRPLIDKSAH